LPYPENIRELSDLFPILWQQIPQEEIDNLIRGIREIIRVRGRNTDYLKSKQKLFHLILILFNFKGLIFFQLHSVFIWLKMNAITHVYRL
jgi:hypothetical protein